MKSLGIESLDLKLTDSDEQVRLKLAGEDAFPRQPITEKKPENEDQRFRKKKHKKQVQICTSHPAGSCAGRLR